jgi:predicted type IV restriction endonuclease
MMGVPKKVVERTSSALRRLVPIIQQQKARDVSEADTVTLVKDALSEVFGYDKYADLTGELAIRGTYCDLAVRLDGKLVELVEVKAIGITLNDRHTKQAVDYAANQGIEWVILTNGITWRLYQVQFTKPIDKRLLAEIDITSADPRCEQDAEKLYLFSKEGHRRGAPVALRDRQDATNRFLVAAVVLNNDDVISAIRRELRLVVDVLVSEDEIRKVLQEEVLKRDVLEGPAAEAAATQVRRVGLRSRKEEAAKEPAPLAEEESAQDSKPCASESAAKPASDEDTSTAPAQPQG